MSRVVMVYNKIYQKFNKKYKLNESRGDGL